jgi:fructokinase
MKNIDILCIGEILIDFIGHQSEVEINNTRDYHRYLGGSPMNVAMNSARLGLNPIMVATIGDDGFGEYVLKRLKEADLSCNHIKTTSQKPTSVIFISQTKGTPDFISYREADSMITEDQISKDLLSKTRIFHTTCFALSKKPAQDTILKKAEEAFNLGCTLSIDLNYSEKIWKSPEEAHKMIKAYCRYNPLIKISEDDMVRFFQKELPHHEIFEFFHKHGAEKVCLTLGSKGVKFSRKGKEVIELPAIQIDTIKDATGAGDAFWSGFLFAYLKDKPDEECLKIALKLAALKLQNVGRLPDNINILSELL